MRVTVSALARGIFAGAAPARARASIARVDRRAATPGPRSTVAGRNGPTMSRPTRRPSYSMRDDPVGRAGEARVDDVARRRPGRAPSRRRPSPRTPCALGACVFTYAQSSCSPRGVREQRAVARVDAHGNAEERDEALAELVERLAIDEVLEPDAAVEDEVLDRGRAGASAVTSAPARCRSRLPPTHDERSVGTSVVEPELPRGHGQELARRRCRASSPSWCSRVELRPRQVQQAEERLEHALARSPRSP